MSRRAVQGRAETTREVGVRHVQRQPTEGVRAQTQLDQALDADLDTEPNARGEQVGLFDAVEMHPQAAGTAPMGEMLDLAWRSGRAQGIATDLFAEDGEDEGDVELPTTIELIPSGKLVKARDGREFQVDRDEVIRRAHENEADLFIDWDHAAFAWFNAGGPRGEQSPAAAWIDHKSIRRKGRGKHAAIVGDVKYWTPDGAESVTSRSYRYISPALSMIRPDEEKPRIAVEIVNAAIVNMPALRMAALASREPTETQETPAMNFHAIAQKLNLSKDASEASILEALGSMQGKLSAAEAKVAELEAQHAASTEVLALAQKEAKEAAEAANAAEDKALDLRVKLLSATGKIEPAKATKLREKAAKYRAAGAYQLFEDELAELEASDARHQAAKESGLDDREPTADGTTTVHGRNRQDVIEAAKRAKTTVAAYCRTNPDYACLFTAKELEG